MWLVRTRLIGSRREPKWPVLWLYYTFDEETITYEGLDVIWVTNPSLRL